MTVSADTSIVPATQVVSGQTGVNLAAFRFLETSNIDDIRVTDLNVFQLVTATSTTKTSFGQLYLYSGATLLGTSGSANLSVATSTPGTGYYWPFHFSTPVVVPKSGSLLLTLKGDVASYSASGISDNTTHSFRIATSNDSVNDTVPEAVVALGNTSSATSSVTLSSASGNNMTVLRTKLTFAAAGLGNTSSRAKAPADNFANLTFTADSAGDLSVNSVVVTFSGTAPSATVFLDGVTLVDENGSSLGSTNTTSSACSGGSSTCTKTFNLGSTTSGAVVSKGTSRTWLLRIDGSKTQTGTANITQTLSATINALTDIRYTTGLDSQAQTTVSLPSNVSVPILLNSASFATGS